MEQFSALVELMKSCIDKYGLWETVAAFLVCCMALSVLAIAWRLPDIIAAVIPGLTG